MITTRESINYQFSLIFGYSSPNEFIVGDVIGPGKLTTNKVKDISISVIKFLRMYNAMLRDYTGSEVFSIEYELYNYDEQEAQTKIFPKSMILIPGRYKEGESLLIALKPETGYLDVHTSRESVNDISELFYEVEEFTDRPDLKRDEKEYVLNKFAGRFSKKLFGELIEDKWNKKLIGLSVSLPTEKKMLNTYASIKSELEILWHKKPIEIYFLDPHFEKTKSSFEGQQEIDHIKYSISAPSANFVVENTLKLGTNLINLANTGTIDESQNDIISYIVKFIEGKIDNVMNSQTPNWLISYVEEVIKEISGHINRFLNRSKEFLISGERGDLATLLEKFKDFIGKCGTSENENYEEICEIAMRSISTSMIHKKDVRASELESVLNYFSEIINQSYNIIKRALPSFLSRRKLITFVSEFIGNLNDKFNNEQDPARLLGRSFLEKFKAYLFQKIELSPLILSKKLSYDEKVLFLEFKELLEQNVSPFFDAIKLNISDIVSFAEKKVEEDETIIKTHTKKFKRFSNELHYLLSYICRYSTINRYLKEEPDAEISDPVTFANKFHRFLEKRIGGIDLAWKTYVLEWINDYAKRFFKLKEIPFSSLKEIYDDFLKYLEEREAIEQQPKNFIKFLDRYIAEISNFDEKSRLLDFFKQYEYYVDIKTEFPNYIKMRIEKEIQLLHLKPEKLKPMNFLFITKEETFYNYIKEKELKYFSKLIPRPNSLILKHILSKGESELFRADLFHVFNFSYWHNRSRTKLADNFQEVYREWIKEL